jgi:hypothetical protein
MNPADKEVEMPYYLPNTKNEIWSPLPVFSVNKSACLLRYEIDV